MPLTLRDASKSVYFAYFYSITYNTSLKKIQQTKKLFMAGVNENITCKEVI